MSDECHRCSVQHDDPVLDREIELHEIARCVRKLKITRLVVVMDLWESFSSMEGQHLLHKFFEVVWSEELVPPKWREGLIVNLLKGDKEDPGNYRGIT